VELMQKGLLPRYIVASIFRVTWGFTLAVLIGVPFGLLLGWYSRAFQAFNPLIQVFRPISPIAWIPVAIMWLASPMPHQSSSSFSRASFQSPSLRARR
jgi:NitT/TauT family transport system permease protein